MAYSELIKNYNKIRDYMRDFFVFGFKTRSDFDAKSARSYDNEKRRVESWMSDYMQFRQDAQGKSAFISVDGRSVPHNPLYNAFKAKSFTDKDLMLHFIILDILAKGHALTNSEIADAMSTYPMDTVPDESTIRKKLKEYVELGILEVKREGRKQLYYKSDDEVNLKAWQDAINYFSEADDIGVIGSFLLDRLDNPESPFTFKHNYFLNALESQIIADILEARRGKCKVEITIRTKRRPDLHAKTVYPLRMGISTQNGRQYLIAYNYDRRRPGIHRLDNIQSVKILELEDNPEVMEKSYAGFSKHLWAAASGSDNNRQLEHIEFTLSYNDNEKFIPRRLEREKRIGTVELIDLNTCRFSADVYEAMELMPWIRTFIGRIESLSCSNKVVEEHFYEDMRRMQHMYGGDDSDI